MLWPVRLTAVTCLVVAAALLLAGCASYEREADDFFTSGSPEADQRAEQRVAELEQIRDGDGEGRLPLGGDDGPVPLHARLGGEEGIQRIVDDWIDRALSDPRVNWQRSGVTRGGWTLRRNESVQWQDSPENVARLKKHVAQFLSVATGGPARYEGGEMKQVHAGLRISNPEFDAAVGDLKATLDRLGVPTDKQRELLAVIESTRPQIVEQR